jgi:peptidoglycan/LPS O-acetylase OafA/YrhL
MIASKAPREYFPALDGLRGIAILLVLLAHNFGRIPFLISLGNYGVDLFFVLSGFLITDILLITRNEKSYFKRFFIHRILRIFPVYYLAILFFYTLAPLSDNTTLQLNLQYYSANWFFVVFHLNNLLGFFQPDFPPSRLWAHLWSLSLEEQFYLVWPFFIYCTRASKSLIFWIAVWIAFAIALRIFVWVVYSDHPVFWYAISSVRFDCLCAGAMLAVLRMEYPAELVKKTLYFFTILLALHLGGFLYQLVIDRSFPQFSVFRYSTYAGCCVLMVLFCIQPNVKHSILRSKILRYFGKISYSLYVFHFPIFILNKIYLLPYLKEWFPNDNRFRIVEGLAATGIAVALSTISYKYFEKRFLDLKQRWA